MKKHILKIAICLALAICLIGGTSSIPTANVFAASTSQMRDEIADLEAKSAELEKEIAKLKKDKAAQEKIHNALKKQVATTQEEIAACTALINSYKSEIREFEKKIEAKEAEISETKFLYRQRMRSICMSGSTNNDLLILLDSESFSDYLALSAVSDAISAHDKKLVNTITDAIEEINESKAEINKKISAQNDVKATLASKQAKLKAQQSEISGVISAINKDKNALEKQNSAYEAAINKLESEIQAALGGATGSKNPVFTSAKFTWPCPGYYNITSYYGYRVNPVSGKYKLHGGIDIASAGIYGKKIVAAADGVVIASGYNTGGYGNWVMINHGTNGGKQYATVYGHMCKAPSVSYGQNVKAGQTIGYVGSTGNSSGNHLHFEIRVDGARVNPMNYFNKAK